MTEMGPCRTELEPQIASASPEELADHARALADLADLQGARIEELTRVIELAAECGRRSVEGEQRLFRAISVAAKGLGIATDMKKRGQAKAAAEALGMVSEQLAGIVAAGCLAVPWPELNARS